ncbi:TetR/AcrR family transcriptional regulator [Methylocella sp.]|uniref:TetR/AcrR family transcriptional regulator n=1 Tax=Methylocella sp. TaxID=1978226 RepID=UPI003784B05E
MSDAGSVSNGRKGRRPSPEKRRALIAAAARLFAELGVDAATTREIAVRAGATERTLFKHFGSKDGLLREVMDAVSADMTPRGSAFRRVRSETPFTRAEFARWRRDFAQESLAAAQAAPDGCRVLFRELFRDPDFASRYAAQWMEQALRPLAAHLARMRDSGEIDAAASPEALACAFFGLHFSYFAARFALAPGAGWDDARDLDALALLVETLLQPDPRAPGG